MRSHCCHEVLLLRLIDAVAGLGEHRDVRGQCETCCAGWPCELSRVLDQAKRSIRLGARRDLTAP